MRQAVPLDYAAGQRFAWKRPALVGGLILGVLIVGYLVWGTVGVAVERAYWAKQCGNFDAPKDVPLWGPVGRDYPRGEFHPYCAQRLEEMELLDQLRKSTSGSVPGPQIYSFGEYNGNAATLFLHERVSPGGHRRLVHVEAYGSSLDGGETVLDKLGTTVMEPSTFASHGRVLHRSGSQGFGGIVFGRVKFSFGQFDPKDLSHFTIEYAIEHEKRYLSDPDVWKAGVIDAYLQDDDTVKLVVRK